MSQYDPLTFVQPALVTIIGSAGTYVLSDHNRDVVAEPYTRIENTRRTAKGTRRRYYIADKVESVEINWTTLPAENNYTVDGNLGADALHAMYLAETGNVTLRLKNRDGSNLDIPCHIVNFERTWKYRYSVDHYYDCKLVLEGI